MPMTAAASSGPSFVPSILMAKSGLRDLSSATAKRPQKNADRGGRILAEISHAWKEVLVGDAKGPELPADRRELHLHLLHPGRGRAALAPGDEFLHRAAGAFDRGLDFAVGKVADLAAEA